MTQYRSDTKVLLPHNKTIYEVFKLSDRLTTSGTATDAFGRLRVSNPFTVFDSQNRYKENNEFNTSLSGSGDLQYIQSESTVNMITGASSGDSCIRETRKVFAYQPGKSLLILNSFAMETAKPGLIQRVGYFGSDNGIYLESNGTSNVVSFVLRSNATGTISETRVPQTEWNVDKFGGDANSYSYQISLDPQRQSLDVSNTNIMWIDVEWLGVGDIRCGFVTDGVLVPAHIFHNDNHKKAVYMTTASLPIRYEIFNESAVGSTSTMKQICSTVISEGGFQLSGRQRTAGQLPNTTVTLATAGVFYPIVSIRLKAENPDAVVIPRAISFLGIGGNGSRIKWAILEGANVSGGVWTTLDANSSVQYNSNAASLSGGTMMKSGYTAVTNQARVAIQSETDLFRDQLKRNTFNGSNVTFTLAAAGSTNGDTCIGSIDWEEVV